MIGLLYLLFFGTYLLVSLVVVAFVVRWAKKREKNSLWWGVGAALLMYHLVFWDWVPSIIQHEYYCRTQAGFWGYKTLDQWKAENPEGWESLLVNEAGKINSQRKVSRKKEIHQYELNARFTWIIKYENITFLGVDFGVGSSQERIVDQLSGDILAKYIGYSVGPGAHKIRFWKSRRCCNDQINQNKFNEFLQPFTGELP